MSAFPTIRTRLGVPAVVAVVLAVTVFAAVPASAHIRLDGDSGTAVAGSTATLTFRVPTESDTASTVGVTVTFPENEPFGSVQPLYKPGWDVRVATKSLPRPVKDSTGTQITSYVASVTWTATGGGIPAQLYDTFTARAGAVPDASSIPLPALQTYSDGTTVDWSEIAQGDSVPQHPAPILTITPGSNATGTPVDGPTATVAPRSSATAGSGDAGAIGLAAGGLAAGILGLVLAVVALVRGTRKATADR